MIHLGQLIEPRIGVSQRLMLRLADKWRPLPGARQEHAQDVLPSFGALRAEHESARSIDFVNCRNHFALHQIFIILCWLLEPVKPTSFAIIRRLVAVSSWRATADISIHKVSKLIIRHSPDFLCVSRRL